MLKKPVVRPPRTTRVCGTSCGQVADARGSRSSGPLFQTGSGSVYKVIVAIVTRERKLSKEDQCWSGESGESVRVRV